MSPKNLPASDLYRNYDTYLRSPEWLARREWALERAGHRCQVCSATERLEVHHRTYENLGAELPGDLVVLCRGCHGLFHRAGRLHSVPPSVRHGILEAIETKMAPPPKTITDHRRHPMHREIQDAKRRVSQASTEEGRWEALAEVGRLCEARRQKVERGEAA